jgi:hypothetical protein
MSESGVNLVPRRILVALIAGIFGALATASAISAATGNPATDPYFTYGVTDPVVQCTFHLAEPSASVVGRSITIEAPGMRSSLDGYMRVSYQPLLWSAPRSNPTAMRRLIYAPESFGTISPWSSQIGQHSGFTIGGPIGSQYFRVSIIYRWYYNGVVIRDLHRWAATHNTRTKYTTDFQSTLLYSGTSCQM